MPITSDSMERIRAIAEKHTDVSYEVDGDTYIVRTSRCDLWWPNGALYSEGTLAAQIEHAARPARVMFMVSP